MRCALLLLLLLGEFVQELVHRGAQILGQFADLLIRRIALQSLAQLLLGRAQIAFGFGKIAILDLQRHAPEKVRNGEEIGVAVRVLQHMRGEIEAEIDGDARRKGLRRDHQGFERRLDLVLLVGIENEIAPLLGERPRQRLDEMLFRQSDLDRIALAVIAAFIARRQHHFDARAGPRMIGEIGGHFRLAQTAGSRRQHERDARRRNERTQLALFALDMRIDEIREGGDDAIIVLDLIGRG